MYERDPKTELVRRSIKESQDQRKNSRCWQKVCPIIPQEEKNTENKDSYKIKTKHNAEKEFLWVGNQNKKTNPIGELECQQKTFPE